MGGRGVVLVVVAVWCGMLGGDRAGPIPVALAAAVLAALAAVGARRWARTGVALATIALGLSGMARAAAQRAVIAEQRAGFVAATGLYRLTGTVAEPPERESGEPTAIVVVAHAEPPLAAGTRVRLHLPPGSAVEWSDRVDVLARLDPPGPIANPGGFDARAAAAGGSLAASGRAFWVVARARPLPSGWPRATFARWRAAIERRLDRRLGPEARELVVPLVLGDRSALSPELNGRLRASGLIHLLALSGLHVAWMVGIARGVAAALRFGPRARAIAGALCAIGYVGPPVRCRR
jgi:competence protein ComEC